MQLQTKQLIPLPLKGKPGTAFSDIWLKDVSLNAGEYTAVLAPSGTGKTSLVHCLYGLRNDFEGSILWHNKDLRHYNPEELAGLRMKKLSVIFQDMRLFPGLTAWENLELKRTLTNTVTEKETENWMQRLGIGDKKNALAGTLSYGEQQRLAIIRSLLQPFSFLLMDEPFSHLDQKNIEIAASLILEITQRNQAGLLLADLDENSFFPYHKTFIL